MSHVAHHLGVDHGGRFLRRAIPFTITIASLIILSLVVSVPGLAATQAPLGPPDDPYVPIYPIDRSAGFESMAAGSYLPALPFEPLQISTIDPSNWPEICAYVEVLDERGNPIGGLNVGDFCVRQDLSDIGSFSVTEIQDNCVNSVCLVIDVSGSMRLEGKLDSAKIAAHQFVNQMGVLDRVGIVTFSTCFQVLQDFTSDKALLHSKINALSGGGYTAAFDGIWKGADLTSMEVGAKAVIALSDGMENRSWECSGPADGIRWDSWVDDSTLIVGLARSVGVPVYTISLGNTFDPSYLKGIAAGSGGDYYHAPTPGLLSGIYSDIKSRLCSRYRICYTSPDLVPDGTCHELVICRRDAAGNCDHCDDAEWCEPDRPTITMNPLPCQPWDQDVRICATVTDADTPPGDLLVRLYYRNSELKPYTEAVMTYAGGVFCATIPGAWLPCGGEDIQYYVTASDGTSNVSSPAGAPIEHHSFPVCPNHDPVCVVPLDQTFVMCQPERVCFPISATDEDGNLLGCHIADPKGNEIFPYNDEFEYCLTPTGTETVTISVHCWDDCGGECYSTFNVSFIIDEPPVLTCPPNYTFNCDAIGDFGVPKVEDESPATVTLTVDQDSIPGNCAYSYQLVRTWTAVDECDNKSECVQTITVRDVVRPTITGVGDDFEIDCPTEPIFSEPSVSDNCDDNPSLTYEDSEEPGVCPVIMVYTRTWTATDECNNTSTASQTITVVDDTPPTIICPETITVACEGDIPNPDAGSVAASDECSATVTVEWVGDSPLSGICPATITRTYRATDECGNSAECTQTITVNDETPPTITCPDPVTVTCVEDIPNPDVRTVIASDNCGGSIEVVWLSDSPLSGACPATVTRTYQATDACGNTAECTQTITVNDETPPSITCPDPVTVTCVEDIPDPDAGAVAASDNCGGSVEVVWLSDSPLSGACPATVTRTYQATDVCGNTAECTQTITVDDETPPSVVCPDPITVQCFDDIPDPDARAVVASDNCGGSVEVVWSSDSPLSGVCPATITRTYLATDGCGNEATCEQIITVNDDVPPTITCPDPITVECLDDIPDPDIRAVVASDNCGGAVEIVWLADSPPSAFCPSIVTRTYQATDDCGNTATCDQTITIDDTTPPELICPDPVTVVCPEDIPDPDVSEVTAWDNCGGPVTVTFVGDSPMIDGEFVRTYGGTDECGNYSECTQIIIVDETTPLSLTCPADATVECDSDIPTPDINSVVIHGVCGGLATVIHVGDVSDNQSCPETITRTYRVTNEAGEIAECDQTIIVDDTTPPSITCPDPVTVECVGDIPDPDIGLVEASDNCGGPVEIVWVGDSPLSGVCPATVTRTYQATDECGNMAQCAQTITVDDTTPPRILCPEAILVECVGDIPDPRPGSLRATDNCGGTVEITWVEDSPLSGSCPSTMTRTYRATDACGNVAECDQTIKIDDITPPTVVCNNDTVVVVPLDAPGGVVEFTSSASDNCALTSFACDPPSGSFFDVGTTTVTCRASDGCNTVECSFTITIENGPNPPVVRVYLDIKPTSCPNPLNVKMNSRGMAASVGTVGAMETSVFPVAILGTADFDVTTIDPTTLRLAGVAPLRWSYEDVAAPLYSGDDCECTTAGPDGFMDLAMKFNKNEIIAAIGPVNNGDEIPITITGYLYDGTEIIGTDCVLIRATLPAYMNIKSLTAGAEGKLVTWNHPNPFNAETVINFALAEPSQVRIEVYDILGHQITTLLDEFRPASQSTVVWNGRTSDGQVVASGIYFYRIEAGKESLARKMVLLK